MRFGLKLSILIALVAALTLAGCDNGSGDPIEVGSLTAAPADGAVTLNWTDPGVDYTAVEITFSPPAGGVTQPITVPKGTNTKTISGLANTTPYAFTVQLVYSNGYKSPGKTVTATPADPASPAYLLPDPTNTDIAAKFGVSTATDAFTNLHLLISTPEPGDDFTTIIRTGDYIDLPSLTIGATTIPDAPITPASLPFAGYEGRLLRLIVVGINSFNTTNPSAPGHVVFQFQNLPVTHEMYGSNDNSMGYAGTTMQTYLRDDFLPGLQTATGLTNDMLMSPTRKVANKGQNADGTHDITDTLFLPTSWELFNAQANSSTYETSANQARLEYYTDDNHRIKYNSGNTATSYWEASPYSGNAAYFCIVNTSGAISSNNAITVYGCAPAFCVK